MKNGEGVALSWIGSGITFMAAPVNEAITLVSGVGTITLTLILIYKNLKEIKRNERVDK